MRIQVIIFKNEKVDEVHFFQMAMAKEAKEFVARLRNNGKKVVMKYVEGFTTE